jgi:hypothetical protein
MTDTIPELTSSEILQKRETHVFFKKFQALHPSTQEVLSTEVKYVLEPGEGSWSVTMYSDNDIKLGYLNVSAKKGEKIITQVSKSLDKRNFPYPFNEITGVMTGAQEILNQQLLSDGYTVIDTTIPKDRVLSVLSRLRAKNPDGTYPLTTIEKDDKGNYRVRTDLSARMTEDEVAKETQALAQSLRDKK